MQKYFLFFLFFWSINFSAAQTSEISKSSISLSLATNLTASPELRNYYSTKEFNAAGFTFPSIGYEGRISYRYLIFPKLYIEGGLSAGVQTTKAGYSIDNEFVANGGADRFYTIHNLFYASLNAGSTFKILTLKRSELGCSIGGRGLFFVPSSTRAGDEIMSIRTTTNSSSKLFFAPEAGVYYQRYMSDHFALGLRVDGSFSENLVISSGSIILSGDKTTLHGDLKKKYAQIGLGIVFLFSF